jgi:hypothetical protein
MLTATPLDELARRAGNELGVSDLSLTLTFERAAGGKPVCVSRVIYRVYEDGVDHA